MSSKGAAARADRAMCRLSPAGYWDLAAKRPTFVAQSRADIESALRDRPGTWHVSRRTDGWLMAEMVRSNRRPVVCYIGSS